VSESAKESVQAPRHRRTTPLRIPICLEAVPLFSRPLRVRSVGADEVPGVYETIVKAMDAQRDRGSL
jgi:hypothetical protein